MRAHLNRTGIAAVIIGVVAVAPWGGAWSPAAADSCSIPSTADDGVLVTMKDVLDAAGVSSRVRLAAYETAWVESHANDLTCGDADSVGVFQQRPSTGWTHASDPELATYDFLYGNPSDTSAGAISVAATQPTWSAGRIAQAVQRSAFPDRYDDAATKANELIARAAELDNSESRESGHSVVSDNSGRVWSFAITQSGTLRYRHTGSSGWEPWVTVGSGYKSVAATLDGPGRVLFAYVTDDDVLKVRRTNAVPTASDDGGGFGSSSSAFGAGDWANVSVTTDRLGRVWLAATKTYGRAYFMSETSTGSWPATFHEFGNSGWRSVSIAAESGSDGRVWIFGTKSDAEGALYYQHTDATLVAWDDLTPAGIGWDGDVSASGDGAGRMWMFGVTNGVVKYRHTDPSGWGDYVTVPQTGWVSISSGVKTTTGAMWMFATKTNGDLSYRYTTSTAPYWTDLTAVAGGPWR
jgi:hypothetical protein